MSSIGKLIDLTTLGGTITGLALMQRLLSQAAVIVALTIISSIMIVLVMIAGFYLLYEGLIHYGLSSLIAWSMTGGSVLVLTIILIGITIFRLRRLQEPRFLPVMSEIRDLADAFVKGFFSGH